MPLPTPNLDDLRFQRDLVDEARRRIIRYCPEWTDYNVSDPGITLVELFAWMTEMLLYRLNRVPEKSYITFLDLLGVQLQPATSARTELTFWLSAPFPLGPGDETRTVVPAGTEVATWPTPEEPEVVFTSDRDLVLAPSHLAELRRGAEVNRNYLSRLGLEDFHAFDREHPQTGDTFYLGFDEGLDISGYILRLAFTCQQTEAPGVRREDPPWVWECSTGDGHWEEVPLGTRPGERDTTGGLNNAEGSLVLYLPLTMKPDQVHGRAAYWVRCRIEQRREGQGMYAQAPRIRGIAVHVLGGTRPATHAQVVPQEFLGRSDGEPGQLFRLQNAPVLALRPGETVEVEEERDGEIVFIPWQRVQDLSASSRYDRHFTLDEATGEVAFGPCLYQPDGTMRQYGRVPEAGRAIRISRYRHGGGTLGNVPEGKLQVLRSAIPYIDRAVNLRPALGGQSQESLEEAKMRVQREIRAQQRAVSAEDFEVLARQATREVARVRCNAAQEVGPGGEGPARPGRVELLVVPAASDALSRGDLAALAVDAQLKSAIRSHLDRFRLLTVPLYVREPRYLGVTVRARIAVSEYHQPEAVRARIAELLRLYIAPLPLPTPDRRLAEILPPGWEGWPFGRPLYVAEVYSLLQQVAGVKHVLDVQLAQRPLVPGVDSLGGEGSSHASTAAGENDAAASEHRVIQPPPDTLLCLLNCQVEVVSL